MDGHGLGIYLRCKDCGAVAWWECRQRGAQRMGGGVRGHCVRDAEGVQRLSVAEGPAQNAQNLIFSLSESRC